jgi:adenylate cyclase
VRAFIYALISSLLLSVYGGKVCPVIAQYPFWKWTLLCLSAFAGMSLAREFLQGRIVLRTPPFGQAPRQLRLELILNLSASLYMFAVSRLVVGSPPENCFKVMVAVLLMGLFFSLELTLNRERLAVLKAVADKAAPAPGGRYFSLTTKFSLVATAAILLGAVAVAGVVIKDIYDSFSDGPNGDLSRNIQAVVGVMLAQGLWCLMSYAKNMKLYFTLQTTALDRVAGGNLDSGVPVVTRDEFGLIAAGTNQMIEGLRERRRIKDIFGKLVSPQIASRLLGLDAVHGGERLDAVVAFADIRGFTALSEDHPPEEVVALLNDHFTRLVKVVHGQGGLVDKFIGDAVMAVFGLDGEPDACAKAVIAALSMVEASRPLGIGVGVHAGPVVAGVVGSPERLEFTVIGDTVNTASRLQEATKETGTAVVISGEVMRALPEGMRARFGSLGARRPRGKSGEVEMFGLMG